MNVKLNSHTAFHPTPPVANIKSDAFIVRTLLIKPDYGRYGARLETGRRKKRRAIDEERKARETKDREKKQ